MSMRQIKYDNVNLMLSKIWIRFDKTSVIHPILTLAANSTLAITASSPITPAVSARFSKVAKTEAAQQIEPAVDS